MHTKKVGGKHNVSEISLPGGSGLEILFTSRYSSRMQLFHVIMELPLAVYNIFSSRSPPGENPATRW
jgi:hypothetical protein